MAAFVHPAHRTIWLLLPIAILVATACSQPTAYNGPQPRTPVKDIPASGQLKNFELIANNPLLDPKYNLPRGQNGGITAIRDCLYVGSNIGYQPALIVDMKDMTKPTVVGEVPGIAFKGMGVEAIEGVADLNLLVVTARGGDAKRIATADKNIGLVVYDATDCRKPTIVAKVDVGSDLIHYMTLWRDPAKPDRVLVDVNYCCNGTADGIDLRVFDLTGCPKSCSPKQVAEWGLRAQFGIPQRLEVAYEGGKITKTTVTHDATWSIDGTRLHVAQMHFGYFQLDSSALARGQSCNPKSPTTAVATGYCLSVLNPDLSARVQPYGIGAAHTHGIVKVPGRPYVAVQHEPSSGCPYGGIQMVYVGTTETYAPGAIAPGQGQLRGDLFPKVVSEFGLPEDQVDRCGQNGDPDAASGLNPNFNGGIHNLMAFPNVMFATWYSGGLRAIDITNPYMPFELGYFFNKPPQEVRWCQGAGCKDAEVDGEGIPIRQQGTLPPEIIARSYPIAMNGYLVYADSNNGVYVLKYTGPHASEIPKQGICIAHNPSVVSVGYEPCAPYK
ncbi:MAG: hypothetical protein E6H88_08805 [Chloroflexi bacterium]|nr:MAG: hypothetical protein E6I20_07785 [Chloroflexota bacterium]TMG36781.1 MAG: hypothetical protein E6H88_08805 [Chloroflexota bacterium]